MVTEQLPFQVTRQIDHKTPKIQQTQSDKLVSYNNKMKSVEEHIECR